MNRLILFFALTLLVLSPFASADIPHLISLQGRLTDASDNPVSSSSNFAFRIYDAPAGGSPLWTEFQTLSPNSLGVFSALLGSVAALNIPFNASYWLEVQVNSEVLSPRTRMGSAGYALRSESPWNATGNNIFTTNTGNVGIGTASPLKKLDVVGDINATGSVYSGGAVLGGIPSGMIAFFASSFCPSGWTEYTALRGRAVVGLVSSGTVAGTQGTALGNLGTRTITDVPAHTHSIDPPATATDSQGSHTHSLPVWSNGGGSSCIPNGGATCGASTTSGAAGAHTHNVDITPFTSGSTGTASVDVSMPYIQLLACQKS